MKLTESDALNIQHVHVLGICVVVLVGKYTILEKKIYLEKVGFSLNVLD